MYFIFQFCKLLVAILVKAFALLTIKAVKLFIGNTKQFILLLFNKIRHCLARIWDIFWMQSFQKFS